MKNTVLERIENLKESIARFESPDKVISEVKAIFKAIELMENEDEREQAMGKMLSIAMFLIGETEKIKVPEFSEMLTNKVRRIQTVNVQVSNYINADVVKISKKIPYSELCTVLNKVREDFNSCTDDLVSLIYNKVKKHIEFNIPDEKDLILDVESWDLSDESIDIYIEGLVEYLTK